MYMTFKQEWLYSLGAGKEPKNGRNLGVGSEGKGDRTECNDICAGKCLKPITSCVNSKTIYKMNDKLEKQNKKHCVTLKGCLILSKLEMKSFSFSLPCQELTKLFLKINHVFHPFNLSSIPISNPSKTII